MECAVSDYPSGMFTWKELEQMSFISKYSLMKLEKAFVSYY